MSLYKNLSKNKVFLLIICFSFNNCNKKNDSKTKGFVSYEYNGIKHQINSGNDNNIVLSNSGSDISINATPILNKSIYLGFLIKSDTCFLDFNSNGEPQGMAKISVYDGTDQQCPLFIMDTSDKANNWVIITKQENDYRHIIGEFSATLVKHSEPCFLGNPYGDIDTIRIRNGKFDICD